VYPVMLRGPEVEALVVGGGAVAERKTRSLLDGGARVRLVAPAIAGGLRTLATASARLVLEERSYRSGDIGDALLVVAATNRREVNAQVAADARAATRLVNVADEPEQGNCVTPAVHRAGDLVVAVTAGMVPAAAVRVRDAIARRLDARYAGAVRALARLRDRLLIGNERAEWRRAMDSLVTADFCERVESGTFEGEVASWR
jgi:siroheme synthase-like protein